LNEKLTELLFIRYASQSIGLGKADMYAPSSREEFTDGYDAKLMATNSVRELMLQFKKATVTKRGFTINLTPHQHKRLRKYEPRTAFYVAPTFRCPAEIQGLQRSIQTSIAFLTGYIAIEISHLPTEVSFIQYQRSEDGKRPTNPKFKLKDDGNVKTAKHPIKQPNWMTGKSLIDKFKRYEYGTTIVLFKEKIRRFAGSVSDVGPEMIDKQLSNEWAPSFDDIESLADGFIGSELTAMIRGK
tara:strand:- start:12 stop:737 length:726 start_codon:yes stop_codon:yes gene_type:complete